MEKEKEAEYTVNGFRFGSKDDVEIAQQELSAIQYIDKKIENRSAETILSVYQATLEKRMFRTPIGYAYLHDLQKRMLQTMQEQRLQRCTLSIRVVLRRTMRWTLTILFTRRWSCSRTTASVPSTSGSSGT